METPEIKYREMPDSWFKEMGYRNGAIWRTPWDHLVILQYVDKNLFGFLSTPSKGSCGNNIMMFCEYFGNVPMFVPIERLPELMKGWTYLPRVSVPEVCV
jgi:hypothetical protein